VEEEGEGRGDTGDRGGTGGARLSRGCRRRARRLISVDGSDRDPQLRLGLGGVGGFLAAGLEEVGGSGGIGSGWWCGGAVRRQGATSAMGGRWAGPEW
jgi:hypothetical protein